MFVFFFSMKIYGNRGNNIYFRASDRDTKADVPINDDKISSNDTVSHPDEYDLPYHNIYSERGRTDYRYGADINKTDVKSKQIEYDSIFSLPIKNIASIEGTKNSYKGPTLVTANQQCLNTIKKTGVETIVDLVGYYDYGNKVKNAGFDFYEFNMKIFIDSAAVESLRDHQKNSKLLFKSLVDVGIDIDVDDCLKRSEKKFYENTRDGINQFVDFINIMQKDNVYVGDEYGTQDADFALYLNDAFNPKRQDLPLNIPTLPMLNSMFNIYYNLTPEDKQKMGWTKETGESFFNRMTNRQMELFSQGNYT